MDTINRRESLKCRNFAFIKEKILSTTIYAISDLHFDSTNSKPLVIVKVIVIYSS